MVDSSKLRRRVLLSRNRWFGCMQKLLKGLLLSKYSDYGPNPQGTAVFFSNSHSWILLRMDIGRYLNPGGWHFSVNPYSDLAI